MQKGEGQDLDLDREELDELANEESFNKVVREVLLDDHSPRISQTAPA